MTQEDLPHAAELFTDAFGLNGLGEPWTCERGLEHLSAIFDPHWCFCATVDEKPVGYCIGMKSMYEHGFELFIDTLVVDIPYRGKKIGSTLLAHSVENAKQNGCVGIRLVGNPKLRSFAWYQKQGITKSGWIELSKRWE